jgi:3-oxoacyl-[acyl-carrier protein] reductase
MDISINYPGAILITGSNGGIGSVLVDYLLSHGVRNIACQYRSSNNKIILILNKYKLNPENHCFRAELTNEKDLQNLKNSVVNKLGRVWGLINLAGASSNGMSWKLSKDEFQNIVNANLLTTFLCCREFIPLMRENQGGRIVNISSVIALKGTVGASHYCAAKAGIVGFTKALALELVNKNITVNTLVLGYYEYGIINQIPPDILAQIKSNIPMQRLGKANEIGGVLLFLLGEDGSYTTGQAIHINGGMYG